MKVKIIKYYYLEKKDKEIIKKWLKENNLKYKDLAEKLDIHYDHLTHILSGDRTICSRIINHMIGLGINLSLRCRIIGEE